ncbi:asparagine synthetase B [Candidatus Bathyarchaeota archaeon]|nr:asparagine synthetase B [Candidatus Bathyarchaeota archaeon]
MNSLVAVIDKKEREAAKIAMQMLEALDRKKADLVTLATGGDVYYATSLNKLRAIETPVAIGHIFLKITADDEPIHKTLKDARLILDGRIYSPIKNNLQDVTNKAPLKAAEKIVKEIDGGFAFTIAEKERIIFGRDSLGIHPLYYGENEHLLAVASELKALWRIGIKDTKACPPGHIAIANRQGVTVKSIKTLTDPGIKLLSMNEASAQLQTLLIKAVQERIHGLNEAAVAFSGGLDSSLTAFMLKNAGLKIHLIHVSLEGQPEIDQADEAAKILDMPLHLQIYDEEDVEKVLPKVLWAIEEPNPIKASIGVPFFWAAENTVRLGYRVLFAGQGADELFGGYRRYVDIYQRYGSEAAREAMVNDTLNMHEANFERDYKLCSQQGVELRMPFADYELALFALRLPTELKISSTQENRKILLRKTAEKLGLPAQIANKPKKAIQYATGVSKVLRKLAKKNRQPLRIYLQKVFENSVSLTLTDIKGA